MKLKLIFTFFIIFCLSLTAQEISADDVKEFSSKLNDQIIGTIVDPSTGIKGRGVISIGKKIIFQYDVPNEWYPFDDIKEVVTRNLIESGNTKIYVYGKIDIAYYYFKNDRLIKMVNIDWEDLNFSLGDYIELTNHPKSNGLEFKLKSPLGWEIKEGDGPHIVKKFVSDDAMYLIFINEIEQFYSSKEVVDLFSNDADVRELLEAFGNSSGLTLSNYKIFTIENHPFIYTHGTLKKERMGYEMNGKVHFWISFIEDQLVYFMGSSYSDNDYYTEFFKITNSLKLLNQYY